MTPKFTLLRNLFVDMTIKLCNDGGFYQLFSTVSCPTLRSLFACLPVQRYSTQAVMQATPSPASSTTKIPPTLAIEREAAFPLSDFSCELALVRAV